MDNFVASYLETALWSSTVILPCLEEDLDSDGCMDVPDDHPLYDVTENDPIDKHFSIYDCTDELVKTSTEDCMLFIDRMEKECLWDKALEYCDEDRIAHDFWLTRNGHGCGFWDGDYGDIGDEITELVRREFNEVNLCVTEEGEVDLL